MSLTSYRAAPSRVKLPISRYANGREKSAAENVTAEAAIVIEGSWT